jgi:pantetheine-phosphate adenylyltransferase
MTPDGRIAVCPGSYDPVTNGHLDIIERASTVFERVVVGVVNQPLRKSATLFSADERKAFLLQATEKLGNVEIEVFDTLLVDFARKCGARALVKGLRAISDFEYEFEMNQLNRKLAPDIESVYLIASSAPVGSGSWRLSGRTSRTWCRRALQRPCTIACRGATRRRNFQVKDVTCKTQPRRYRARYFLGLGGRCGRSSTD